MKRTIIFVYNLLFPIVFLFFLPGMIYKLIRRSGEKSNFPERFSIFTRDKINALSALKKPVIWVHSVSVGETLLAVDFIRNWKKKNLEGSFVISTTTTTGQTIALNANLPGGVVIFCPIDFIYFVRRAIRFVSPKVLVIFETEIWPNLINECRRNNIGVIQVNARISDHSYNGYYKWRRFIGPVLSMINVSCAQTDVDVERLKSICSTLNVVKTGTMKFDQAVPSNIRSIDLAEVFGGGSYIVLLAASTHPGEEKLIAGIYLNLLYKFKDLKLIIVPRHAERGGDVASMLEGLKILFHRRSKGGVPAAPVNCLLADTTGEMLGFMQAADIVIMGKCFAGNSGGHNIIEPALFGKPVVTGKELSNFRFVLDKMLQDGAVVSVNESELESVISKLLSNKDERLQLGIRAKNTVMKHIGATEKTIAEIRKLL